MLSFGDLVPALPGAGPACPLPSLVADDELARGLAWARRLVDADRSAGTLDKYYRNWALFVHWLGTARPQLDPCPAHPAAIGIYIGVLRDRGLTKTTILGYVAAIVYVHQVAGVPSPVNEATIRRELAGLRRQADADRQDRAALEREAATAMVATLLTTIRAQPGGPTLYDLRDVAMFTLGWLSALRRSTIAALRRCDVVIKRDDLYHRRYLEIFVAASKTDQERAGRHVIVNELPIHEPLCALRALETWLGATPDRDLASPLFPTFAGRASGGHLTDRPIDGRDVARAVKRIATKAHTAGLDVDPAVLAAHALRRGFATSAINKGVRRSLVRHHGGCKTDAMLDRYTRVDESRDNAVGDLFE